MTVAGDQPYRREWVRRSQVVTPSGIRATVSPLRAAGVGLLSALVGAWGAICVFIGPYFGYRPTSTSTWEWTTNNWMLHLLPGAVAVAAGLMIMTLSPAQHVRGVRSVLGLAAVLLTASGAWFVIGPALWPTFQSTPAYTTGTGAWTSFWNQLGANLGPGLLLAFFGGMALKASTARPAVTVGEPVADSDPEVAPPEMQGVTAPGGGRAIYHERTTTTTQPTGETRDGTVTPGQWGAYEERDAYDERDASAPQPASDNQGGTATPGERDAYRGRDAYDERDATTLQPAVSDHGPAEGTGGPAPDGRR